MCLYPKLITNPKYKPNKKNGGRPPEPKDPRVLKVPIGCNKCIECKKQKARNWQVRLHEELRENRHHAEFVTLTFSNESYHDLKIEVSRGQNLDAYAIDNAIASLAVRRFTERYRKRFKVAPRHWLITELGHENTEHLHIHGIVWNHIERSTRQNAERANVNQFKKDLKEIWGYGHAGLGEYVNERTVNYIIKYVLKQDQQHKAYDPITLTSKGIGSKYTLRVDAFNNRYKAGKTREYYTNRQGFKLALPIYYRNKIYSEDEREKLWLEKLDKQERWILGSRIDISKGDKVYLDTLKHAQQKNERLGYGNRDMWQVKKYEQERRALKQEIRKSLELHYVNEETGEVFVNPKKNTIIGMKLKLIGNDQ